uniref:hypothetical protein n=1 Tax=Vibrio cholerae TaxID=666 RepID=UPI003F587C39
MNSESTKPTKAGEVKNVVRFAKTGLFDNDTVVRLARQLAKKPYVALKRSATREFGQYQL